MADLALGVIYSLGTDGLRGVLGILILSFKRGQRYLSLGASYAGPLDAFIGCCEPQYNEGLLLRSSHLRPST